MHELAKFLIYAGLGLAAVGLLVLAAGKIPGLGRLPGDILIRRENFTFYFPLTTGILVSLVLTLVLTLWGRK